MIDCFILAVFAVALSWALGLCAYLLVVSIVRAMRLIKKGKVQ